MLWKGNRVDADCKIAKHMATNIFVVLWLVWGVDVCQKRGLLILVGLQPISDIVGEKRGYSVV